MRPKSRRGAPLLMLGRSVESLDKRTLDYFNQKSDEKRDLVLSLGAMRLYMGGVRPGVWQFFVLFLFKLKCLCNSFFRSKRVFLASKRIFKHIRYLLVHNMYKIKLKSH